VTDPLHHVEDVAERGALIERGDARGEAAIANLVSQSDKELDPLKIGVVPNRIGLIGVGQWLQRPNPGHDLAVGTTHE
jgi:hypothetical protein